MSTIQMTHFYVNNYQIHKIIWPSKWDVLPPIWLPIILVLPPSNLFYTPSFQENFPAFFNVGPLLEDTFSGHLNNLSLCAPFCSA